MDTPYTGIPICLPAAQPEMCRQAIAGTQTKRLAVALWIGEAQGVMRHQSSVLPSRSELPLQISDLLLPSLLIGGRPFPPQNVLLNLAGGGFGEFRHEGEVVMRHFEVG